MRAVRPYRFTIALLMALALVSLSAAAQAAPTRLLLIGDSWATLLAHHQVFDRVLNESGLPQYRSAGLHMPGSEAAQWNSPFGKFFVGISLLFLPDVKVVVVSLGGNDLIDKYRVGTKPAVFEGQIAEVQEDLASIVDFITGVRKDVQVVLIGYDYPNFVESVESGFLFDYNRERWEKANEPLPEESNAALAALSLAQYNLAAERERVHFVNNMGLMQYVFGYPRFYIQPGSLPPPSQDPESDTFMGGDPTLASPPEAMLQLAGIVDSIHLNELGYVWIGRHAMQCCIADILTGNAQAAR